MSRKRFTDTTIWEKPWFRKLKPAEKEAFRFIKDKCDAVGVWVPDKEAAEFFIGEQVDWDQLLNNCNGNIEILENGKWFIIDFCSFQYGKLNERCKPHESYLKLLRKHGLVERINAIESEDKDTYTSKRKRVTQSKKKRIYSRDQYTCQYCGKQFQWKNLCVDHIIPLSKGGNGDDENLATACIECNKSKSDTMPDIFAQKRGIFPLERVSKILDTLKEKEEEKEEEKELEEEEEEEEEKDAPAMKNELESQIDQAFRSVHEYANWGKERAQVKKLARIVRSRSPTDPAGYISRMMDTYYRLTQSQEKFWRDQPFTPSRLVSNFDAVEKQLGDGMSEETKRYYEELLRGG
jgi:5-methylcytosine-specific restriction endonuclease McrA